MILGVDVEYHFEHGLRHLQIAQQELVDGRRSHDLYGGCRVAVLPPQLRRLLLGQQPRYILKRMETLVARLRSTPLGQKCIDLFAAAHEVVSAAGNDLETLVEGGFKHRIPIHCHVLFC